MWGDLVSGGAVQGVPEVPYHPILQQEMVLLVETLFSDLSS
jgi:hypothetical protein